MINLRKLFNGGINADHSPDILKPGEWINASNIRTFSTDNGTTNCIAAVGGTAMLFNTLPTGQNYCIGGCKDDSKNRIYFFNWNSTGEHGIYCYDKIGQIGYNIIVSSQVTGGLNFSKYAYIHSCRYLDNKLYWTDNLNEPRRINVEAGIKLNQPGYATTVLPYANPLAQSVLTIIRQAPNYCPIVVKSVDSSFTNNFISKTTTQYAIRYQFRDYEYSVIGSYSIMVPYNNIAQLENLITITAPLTAILEQDILSVDLLVRYSNGGQPFVIHTWDITAINLHNSGTTALTYAFYNDIIGSAVDAVSAYKPFESIGTLAQTLELAKNRLFLAGTVQGYDTPATTSLTLSLQSAGAGGLISYYPWTLVNFPSTSYYYYASPQGFYYFSGVIPPSTPPSPIDLTTATYFSPSINNMITYLAGITGGQAVTSFANTSFQSAALGVVNTSVISRAFKSNGTYRAATWFFDKYRRKCGVVFNEINKITTPDRDFGTSVFNSGILWQLNNTNALNEIPVWADSYCVGRTKNNNTTFFMQGQAGACVYADKDTLKVPTYTDYIFAISRTYIAIDISTIVSFGMGYQFNDGDICKLYFDQTVSPTPKQELQVIGTDGKWLLLQAKNIGTLPIFSHPKFEIYTPYKDSLNELYYEIGATFPILNAGQSARQYSTLNGLFNGDIFLMQRTVTYPLAIGGFATPVSFFTENMSPIDKFWRIWQTDIGWPNAFDKIGQTVLGSQISFSDVYLIGTKVNGLSAFSPLNVKTLDSEDGLIVKLELANKIQSDGTVMLAICEDETVSCYLGEQELFDTQGSAFLAQATTVIGSTKALRGSNGCKDPESVFEYNGLVFWYDVRNGAFVRYADNGLFKISNNKIVRPANLFSKKFNTLANADMEALGSRPFVIGGFDPYHNEALYTIPSTEATPPKGFLTDFPTRPYPYDIYDGNGKTLIYKSEADMWMGSMSFQAEKILTMGNDLFSFKNGALYIHNQQNVANFYGQQFTANIMFSNNPGAIHRFLTIGLECNKKPSWTHFRTEDPFIQSSDLVLTNYTPKEAVLYTPILRDRLSPNTAGSFMQKQISGDPMYGKSLLTMLEFEFVNDPKKLELKYTNISHTVSKGHLMTNGRN